MVRTNNLIHFTKALAAIFATVFFVGVAMADDWSELNTMNEEELTEKIVEFKDALDRNPDDYETLKGLGIAFHIKALKEPKKFASKAVKTLTKAIEMNSTDYVALCYLGSATSMMANTTWNFFKKGDYANKGFALMDKAVRMDPDNVSIRLTRAYNSKNVPGFLNRGDIAIEDFEHLAEMIKKNPVSLAGIKGRVYINLAQLYEKNGEDDKAAKYKEMAEGL